MTRFDESKLKSSLISSKIFKYIYNKTYQKFTKNLKQFFKFKTFAEITRKTKFCKKKKFRRFQKNQNILMNCFDKIKKGFDEKLLKFQKT